MNEEIERLIFDLEGCCGMFDYMLTPLENSLLVSYIKDLQQENQQLKKQLEHYKTQEIERINKNLLDAENNYLESCVRTNMVGE